LYPQAKNLQTNLTNFRVTILTVLKNFIFADRESCHPKKHFSLMFKKYLHLQAGADREQAKLSLAFPAGETHFQFSNPTQPFFG